MVPDFVAEEDFIELAEGADARAKEVEKRQERQQAYVLKKRGQQLDQPDAWQSRKRHRKDTQVWLAQTDQQLQASTGSGLKAFQLPADPAQRPPWDKWPLLSYAGDQGSKEECGKWALKTKFNVNFDEVPDPGHGVWNDCKLALRMAGHYSHVGLMMIAWNMRHGPWAEDARQKEIEAVISNFFADFPKPQQSPLFMSLVQRMSFDQEDTELEHCEDLPGEMYRRFKEENPFAKKYGAKVNWNRFMGFLKQGRDEASRWTFTYLSCLLCCLEQGYFSGAKFRRVLFNAEMELTKDRTTSSAKMMTKESEIIKSAQNQVVVATLMLSSHSTQRRQRSIDKCLEYQLQWFEQQAHELRSVDSTVKWLTEQIAGKFCESLMGTLNTIASDDTLAYIGFELPKPELCNRPYTSFFLEEEDWLAGGMAKLALCTVGCRLARCAWMLWGWSARSVLWLIEGDDNLVAKEIAKFKYEWLTFQDFKMRAQGHAGAKRFVDQSQFNWLPVQQLVLAMEENHWEMPSPKIIDFLKKKHKRIISSQIVEDAFGRQKGYKAMHFNRRLKVAGIWDVLQRRHLVDHVHHYRAPRPEGSSPNRIIRVPASIFGGKLGCTSIDFSKVSSLKAKADFLSTSAELHCLQFFGQALMDFVLRRGCFDKIKNTFLNVMVNVDHMIIMREVLETGGRGIPKFAISSWPGSIGIGWPAYEHDLPGLPGIKCFSLSEDHDLDDLAIPLIDVTHWEAVPFVWRSPAWQQSQFPAAKWPSWSIKAFPMEQPVVWKPLLQVAAEAGFWKLKSSFLTRLGGGNAQLDDHEDEADEGADGDLFKQCFEAVQRALGCSEEAAVDILKKRAVQMDMHDTDCWDQILEADECTAIFDKEEAEQFRKQRDKTMLNVNNYRQFLKNWQTANGRVLAKSIKGAKKGGGKGAASKPSKYPPMPETGASWTQAKAKTLCPPGGSIWRGMSSGSWACHLPPWKRRSYPWDIFGFDGAAKECLKHMWHLYLTEQNEPLSACPIKGLFPAAVAVAPGAASSSTG